jgi:D-alanine-D-alanine ligase
MLKEYQNRRIAVLCGGKSSERDISLKSGQGVFNALNKEGYDVTLIDTAKHNELIKLISNPDVTVFNCLHGKGGEDGEIQGLLDSFDIKYTGSGILSCAISINKILTKNIYRDNNIPTPRYTYIDSITSSLDEIYNSFNGNLIVKAPNEGSSIGVYIPNSFEEFKNAIEQALIIDDEVLIEEFIKGKEYTVAVLDINNNLTTLPVVEIQPKNNTYDFESKYAVGGSVHVCPAEINSELSRMLQKYALKAHKSLKCFGVSRTDFIVDSENKVWTLETNTVPGMTETSLLPDAAKAIGYSYLEVCEMLLKSALLK